MPHLARSQILTGYAPLARTLGLAPEHLVRRVGLDLATLSDLDSRISATAFAQLLERSAAAAKVEDDAEARTSAATRADANVFMEVS